MAKKEIKKRDTPFVRYKILTYKHIPAWVDLKITHQRARYFEDFYDSETGITVLTRDFPAWVLRKRILGLRGADYSYDTLRISVSTKSLPDVKKALLNFNKSKKVSSKLPWKNYIPRIPKRNKT